MSNPSPADRADFDAFLASGDVAEDRRDDLYVYEPPPPVPWTTYLGYVLVVLAVVGAVLFALSPAPYVIERPGPVYDTLGQVRTSGGGEVDLIDIPEAETYPTSGRLDLLTVYLKGSPNDPPAWIDVAAAWFDPSLAIIPMDLVFPPGRTEEDADEESALDMANSQQDAVAAALGELGMPVDSVLTVFEVVEGSPSEGVLEVEDQILSANGTPVADIEQLRTAIQEAGVGGELVLVIRRGGVEQSVTVEPETSEETGNAIIGVAGTTAYAEFPVEVDILLENVGGPSAGMMFALGIYDKLTPGELTGGEHIAGTGTITGAGKVGAIGGIVQKMYGARDAGADWFLAPESNCRDVVGNIPDGIEVFAVSDLAGAIDTVEAIAAGSTSQLPRCR